MLAALALICACGRDTREGDPYAARLATEKPPFVRSATAAVPVPPRDTGRTPEFTAAQALQGAAVYAASCARCHATSQWKGGTFAATWQDRRLSDFYDLVTTTMPQDSPGSLAPDEFINVTAYVLELAGFNAGARPLRADTAQLRHARLAIDTLKPAS